jgi:hypothetical protein
MRLAVNIGGIPNLAKTSEMWGTRPFVATIHCYWVKVTGMVRV